MQTREVFETVQLRYTRSLSLYRNTMEALIIRLPDVYHSKMSRWMQDSKDQIVYRG